MTADLDASISEAEDPDSEQPAATITLGDQQIRLRPNVPYWVLMRFMGEPSRSVSQQMAILYRFLSDVIDPEDWALFEQAAIDTGVGYSELLNLGIDAMTARPTVPSSDSDSGPPTTGPTSKDDSPPTRLAWPSTIPSPPPDLRPVPQPAQERASFV